MMMASDNKVKSKHKKTSKRMAEAEKTIGRGNVVGTVKSVPE